MADGCGAALEAVYVEPWQSGVDLMPPAGLNASRIRPLRLKIRAAIGAGPKITILEGDPAQTILTHAARTKPDLIVVGTHGRKGLQRLLLGSMAESVIRGAHVPVTDATLVERLKAERGISVSRRTVNAVRHELKATRRR